MLSLDFVVKILHVCLSVLDSLYLVVLIYEV